MRRYGFYNFIFDHAGFSAALRGLANGGGERGMVDVIAGLIDVDRNTVKGWMTGAALHNEGGISMINFLRVCNALDLDPRTFFVLDTVEKTGA